MFPIHVARAPSPAKFAGSVQRSRGAWDWRDVPYVGDTDAASARLARIHRTAARLQNPVAWQKAIENLPHYEADYPYDPAHEYERDWTTDPDYAAGVQIMDFDKDGFLAPTTSNHTPLFGFLLDTLCDGYGNRVTHELEFHFPAQTALDLGRLTSDRKPKNRVVPDLAVLPKTYTLPEGVVRSSRNRVLDNEAGEPVPDLVVEIVSKTSVDRDYEDKMALYAALGISEYLIIEPGEPADETDDGTLGCLLLFRLDENSGIYEPVSDIDDPYIEAAGLRLRMVHVGPSAEPCVQWWDPDQHRWRDHAGDRELVAKEQGFEQGIEQGELKKTVAFLDALCPDLPVSAHKQIESHWQEHGLPDGIETRIVELSANPSHWRTILDVPEDRDDEGQDRVPA